ncbi:MAG: ferrous iron transport protein A [Myxococcales bacterium]|nr:ferrous iron transport protein A [Myxococcales bacterium]
MIVEIQGGYRLRQNLGGLGIHPGDTVEVLQKGHFGGPVLIEIHGVKVAIGLGQVKKIEVEVDEE